MAREPQSSKRRVLLVDDEESLVWSLASRLMKLRPHYEVETAPDGEVALAMMQARSFDLLVADVRMPGMSGIDLVLAARKIRPDLPVVVMTAYKTEGVKKLAGASATSFLQKPFEFEKLLEYVDQEFATVAQGFSGAISVQTLPDVVQLYVLSNTSGVLSVLGKHGLGRMWFERGAITHATTPTDQGDAAFYEIMTWRGGQFGMTPIDTPYERTIHSTWQELLMESVRLLDESQLDDTPRSLGGWTEAPRAIDTNPNELQFDIAGPDIPGPPMMPQSIEQPTETIMNIKESLAKLNEIDGFVGAALVDSESGMLLGQEGGAGLNLEVAAAGNTEVMRAKRKTMNNLGLKDAIEDMLITLGRQYHLIRPLRSRSTLFFYVALDRQRANLAMARIALADVEKDLQV